MASHAWCSGRIAGLFSVLHKDWPYFVWLVVSIVLGLVGLVHFPIRG